MARRANGEGSIYEQRKGLYAAYITGEDSKRKYFYGKTKTKVREKLNTALLEKQRGTLVTGPQQTLKDYLAHWLEHSVKGVIRPRSYERYEATVRLHIVPIVGKVKLQSLTPQHVQKLLSQKLKEGLSPTTVSAIHGVLHKALDDAMKLDLVGRNVSDAVSAPRKSHKEIQPLTAEQSRHLLDTAKGHPQEALFVLALATGMRRGELLGLKWQDITLGDRTSVLEVRRALVRLPTQMGKEGGDLYIEAETKTKSSRRSIVLANFAVEALNAHRLRQGEMRRVAGDAWQDHDYVFCRADGTHLDPGSAVLLQLKKLLEKAGLPDIRFHDLRHSAATLLLQKKVHPKVVQELLGHTKISMTMDIYSHVMPTMQEEAMVMLDEVFSDNVTRGPDRDDNVSEAVSVR